MTPHLIESFGRVLGAELLLHGIVGMPDPGPRWNPKASQPASTLPRGYCQALMKGLVTNLSKWLDDEDLVEEAIVSFMHRFIVDRKSALLDPGTPFEAARGYVMTSVSNQAKNLKVMQKTREDRSAPLSSLEGMTVDSPADPLPNFDQLTSIHPDAPLWVKLRMQGFDKTEIVNGMLPNYPHTLTAWQKTIEPRIEAALRCMLQ